jgi:nucleotide-binding universal stress UspA family protein
MSDNTTRYGLLVCVDGSPSSDAAVVWATREAIMRHVPLTLMHAVAPVVVGWPMGQLYAHMPEWQKDSAQQFIDQARKTFDASLGKSEAPEVRTEVVYSRVMPALIHASKEAWMVVTGSEGMGALGRLLLGSVATALLHHAHCPVAVIILMKAALQIRMRLCSWALTDRRHRKPRRPWRSTKPPAEGWSWWRYTRGATSGCFRCSGWTGMSARVKHRKSWLNAWPDGKNVIRMCA